MRKIKMEFNYSIWFTNYRKIQEIVNQIHVARRVSRCFTTEDKKDIEKQVRGFYSEIDHLLHVSDRYLAACGLIEKRKG